MRRFRDPIEAKEDLRAAADIAAVIGKFVDLQQRGKRWVGFCPFHDNQTSPKFSVTPDAIYEGSDRDSRGVWGCWVCRESGDIFSFMQRFHAVEFHEAMHMVAELAQFDLTPYYRDLTPEEQLVEERFHVVEQVAQLFTEQLLSGEHPGPLQFLLRKGFTEETLRLFQVGYCPSLAFLKVNLHDDVVGLIEPDLGRRAPLFGGRILYALTTPAGRVWGWRARQPDNRGPGVPKYFSTSKDSCLYDTSAVYGLSLARKLIRASKLPLTIVEGFNDAIAAHQAGFPTVATGGTQLTADNIQTLQAHAIKRATICFDPDPAGLESMLSIAKRAHDVREFDLRFATVTLEPEELIAQQGAGVYGEALENALSPLEYIVQRYADRDTTTGTRKRDFLEHVFPFVSPYPRRSLNRALGVQAISRVTGLAEDTIADYLDEKSHSPLMNLTGELTILAELAHNPNSWIEFPDISEEDFSLRRYRQTYWLMRELWQQEAEVNISLLTMHAHNSKAPPEVLETIGKIASTPRKNISSFADDIRDKAMRRRTVEWANSLTLQANDLQTPLGASIAGAIEGMTTSLGSGAPRPVCSSVEAVSRTLIELHQRTEAENGVAGLNLGPEWAWITRMLNGLRPKRTVCIAASSTVGKSLVAINWAHRLSVCEDYGMMEDGDGVARPLEGPKAAGLFVSMEMTPEENVIRLAAIDSGVPHFFIDHSRYESEEQMSLAMASLDRVRSSRITWMEGERTMKDIALQARILQAKGELDYLVIDYITLIDLSPYNHHWSITEKYNAVSWEIKRLSDTLNIPIITVAQLNRQAMKEDIPTGEQMGAAYKIYQDAHSCFILAPRENGLIGNLDKNRGGGKGYVKLHFDQVPETSCLRIKELEVLKRTASR